MAPTNPQTITARPIDMRCSIAVAPDSPAALDHPVGLEHGRCQLLAGHDGEHALMYGDHGTRRVLAWVGTDPPRTLGDWRGLPWMRGYPFPAWFELDG